MGGGVITGAQGDQIGFKNVTRGAGEAINRRMCKERIGVNLLSIVFV